jgi:hypothetical protein
MSKLAALGRFLYDFVVGDDWRVAVGVAVTLAVTALLAHSGVSAWWLPPAAIAAVLGMSVARFRHRI